MDLLERLKGMVKSGEIRSKGGVVERASYNSSLSRVPIYPCLLACGELAHRQPAQAKGEL